MADDRYGVEEARRRLPELLERAHRGERVVITRHGRPYATLREASQATAKRPPFSELRGSGRGLWHSSDAGNTIERLREEW
jgi:prevent-host-death family protein